jgi:Zn-dependent protease with chaperone function
MTSYRYPNEQLILGLTLLLVTGVIAVTATATVCTSVLIIALAVALAYSSSRSHHQALVQRAYRITPQKAPELTGILENCRTRLRVEPVEAFVTPSRDLNAYTFGLSSPKVIVVYSALLKIMDADELRFVIGHELGHIALGHTYLNSLVGGMAGIPSSSAASALLTMAFLSWNRACEHSADRAGLLACGKPDKAISALIKLVAGPAGGSRAGLELAYRQIDAEDDTLWGSLNEAFASHPMLIKRINALRSYAGSAQYKRLLVRMEK